MRNSIDKHPGVKNYGLFLNPSNGFTEIGSACALKQDRTIVYYGVLSGQYNENDKINNDLYCVTVFNKEPVVLTLYEKISKRGIIVYIDCMKVTEAIHQIEKFLVSCRQTSPNLFYATIIGGATFSLNCKIKDLQRHLSTLGIKNTVWGTWSWMPEAWTSCVPTCWVIKLNLKNGNVKTFKTVDSQVKRFLSHKYVMAVYEKTIIQKRLEHVDGFFQQHPRLIKHKKRVLELCTSYKARFRDDNFTFSFNEVFNSPGTYIFVCARGCFSKTDSASLTAMMESRDSEYIILQEKNINISDLPDIASEYISPFNLADEKPQTGTRMRNKSKGQGVNKNAKETPANSTKINIAFSVVESDFFKDQVSIMNSIGSSVFKSALAKIQAIRNDLQHGRLPSKVVKGFYVCDIVMPGGTGRGAWRLLIKREAEKLTLHCIADYHGGRWQTWS